MMKNPLITLLSISLGAWLGASSSIALADADSWQPKGFDAVWAYHQGGGQAYIDFRRQELKQVLQNASPHEQVTPGKWQPNGLFDAVWAHHQGGGQGYIDFRRQELAQVMQNQGSTSGNQSYRLSPFQAIWASHQGGGQAYLDFINREYERTQSVSLR
jgi:hypothetical protein